MQDRILKHFEGKEVISFSENPNLTWEESKKLAPHLSKGWFELSKLDPTVRLEFTRDYWFNSTSYDPQAFAFIDRFFARVKEVAMVAVDGSIYLTYSMKEGDEFFLGKIPLIDQEIDALSNQIDFPLPQDFLYFFRIHNGFAKGGDTGLFSAEVLAKEAERFKSLDTPLKLGKEQISPESLLPFYHSFGLDVYQCFYKEWYPDGAVGNVLCSLKEGTISDYRVREKGREYLAFTSFLEWLIFYVEKADEANNPRVI